MNVETREVKPESALTAEEKASGKWVKIPKNYVPKTPVTDADYRHIMAADAKRKRRAAKRRRDDVLARRARHGYFSKGER